MKKIFTIIILVAALVGCDDDEPVDPNTVNNVEVIYINGTDNAIGKAVDGFYHVAENDKISVEKGLTIKTFSSPEAGDQTKINGKTIELDREYIIHVGGVSHQALTIYIAKQIGKIYFPHRLRCVNKVNFDDIQQLTNLSGQADSFIKSVLWVDDCPI